MARTCCVFKTQSQNVFSNKKASERDKKAAYFFEKQIIRNCYITFENPLFDRSPCSFNYNLFCFLSMHL